MNAISPRQPTPDAPVLTKHSVKRIRQRLGVPKKSAERCARRALAHGRSCEEFTGEFRAYLDNVMRGQPGNNFIRVHGEHLFIFSGNVLITVFDLPGGIKALARRQRA